MQRQSMLFRAAAAAAMLTFAAAQMASACTGIMLRNADGSIVHGRTVEFGIPLEIDYAVVPRNYDFTGLTPLGDGKKWTTKYGVLGAIVFGNLGVMDGINEKGLAIGAFYFPTMAEYTPTTPENQAKSHVVDRLLQLDPHAVLQRRRGQGRGRSGEVVVAPTLLPGWPQTVQPFHWIVYDKSGKAIVIEPIERQAGASATIRSACSPTRRASIGT